MTTTTKVISVAPGSSGVIVVRSVQTAANSTTYSDFTSLPYTNAGTGVGGTNLFTSNSSTDISLTGGSLFVGSGFGSNIGQLNVVSGSTSGTGIILNQSGLAGFNGGVKEFYIAASTGKAYFAGTVTAGSVKIGPNVDPSQTKTGLYINSTNYWYSDGSWSASGSDIQGALIGSAVLKPSAVSALTSSWSGTSLTISFTFDSTAISAGVYSNQNAKDFLITLVTAGGTKVVAIPINRASSSQSYTLTATLNKALFGPPQTSFTTISVIVEDSFGNTSASSSITGAAYVSTLIAPTSLTVAGVNNGYSVAYTTPSDLSYLATEVAEALSSGGTYQTAYSGVLNPITVITTDLNPRWVKARFIDQLGGATSYSPVYNPTPVSPVTLSTTVPTEVTVVSAGFSSGGTGENIVISLTLPASNAGTRFIIDLEPTGYSSTGYFYFYPVGVGLSQTFTITKKNLFDQFGAYYSTFTGHVISASASDVKSSGVSISSFTRSASLGSTTPVLYATAGYDGYSASFDYSSTNATSAEIYQKYTSWSGVTSPVDTYTTTYASGGTSGTNTLVVNGVINEAGVTQTSITVGYKIVGTGIPANTYVSGVSGTTPTFTLTLSNNLTTTASGTYTMNALVYSGGSPASVYSNNYITTYVIARFYDDFGNASLKSNEVVLTPINPVTSLISSAVQIGSGGSIFVGSSGTSGARVLIGANSSLSGIFAFDPTNVNPTTSIIASGSTGGYTLATTSAHIADWNISSLIENTLGGTPPTNGYTGLSGSGTYAFWAGSPVSGGNSSAAFSVTPLGAVKASDITISGGSLNVSGAFIVTTGGALTATSATITGAITATSGSFTGNMLISGSTYSGTPLTQTISSISIPTAGTARYVLSASHSLTTNSTVYISGISGGTPSGSFNGTYKVTAVNVVANSFDVTSTATSTVGTTISITPPIAQVVDVTTGYILNSNGIVFNTSGTKGITTIDSSTGLFTTKSANIGGWNVSTSAITKTNSSGTLTLDSTNAQISAASTTYSAGIATPSANASSDIVFWAGSSGKSTSSNFYVTADGTAHIKGNAIIDGTVTIGSNLASSLITGVTTISGGAITSGTILLSGVGIASSSSVYPRMTLDGNGFKLTTSLGVDTVSIPTSGTATFKGSITSGSTVTGSTFTTSNYGSTTYPGLSIIGSSSTEGIYFSQPVGGVAIQAGQITAATTGGYSGFVITGIVPSVGGYTYGGNIVFTSTGSNIGAVHLGSAGNDSYLDLNTGAIGVSLATSGQVYIGGGTMTIASSTKNAALSSSSGYSLMALRNIQGSSAAPSGGADGDVWLQYA